MSLTLSNPTQLRVTGHTQAELERLLTYRDKSVDFELNRLKHSAYMRQQLGPEGYKERMDELKAARVKCLLYEDEQGLWTLSGFARKLSQYLGEDVERDFPLPERSPLSFGSEMGRTPRPYQLAGNEALLQSVHGAVEIGTGLGKSFMAMMLTLEHGQKTVIMAPSTNIAEQLYDDFVQAFGRRRVGFYGDGKKEHDKLVTIAIAASLTRVEPGQAAYTSFRQARVFIADESHLCPAKTLQKVCFNLMANAPYRYFFSGTQKRGDGADLLLEGITGGVCFEMSVQQGVDEGWLARPFFKMVRCRSDKRYYSSDANKMTRAHLYYNDEVNRIAADLANLSVSQLNQQVLVLIEEYEQFQLLEPLLKFPVGFAHGTLTKESAKYVPEKYHRSDIKALVSDFNARRTPILIGTSCISTGTDIQTAEHVIYLQGGKSEIGVPQAVGRGTRLIPGQGKRFFNFTDFLVECTSVGKETCVEKHAYERAKIYDSIYPNSLKEITHEA